MDAKAQNLGCLMIVLIAQKNLTLPEYSNWFSKLKGDYVLTLDEFRQCQRLFEENGMKTFADWLEYYNNLDVVPALEALVKMREFYEQRELDVFKDAVSISGVSFAWCDAWFD